MSIVFNIRGCNGSGKTTLARAFLPPDLLGGSILGGPVELCPYPSPTKKDPGRVLRVTGYVRTDADLGNIGVVGPYTTPTGGLDNLPSFKVQQDAISYMIRWCGVRNVIAEGVLASTVYGSWAEYDKALGAGHDVQLSGAVHQFAYCYLSTPLDVCLERIKARQEASGKVRDIKTELVADKHKAIAATRRRALGDGRLVYDIPYEEARTALRDIMYGGMKAEVYRAQA